MSSPCAAEAWGSLVKPLSALHGDEARRLCGLLFDLDDTFLSHGVLSRVAYDALWLLHEAGLQLVAVTGRPLGWGTVLTRQWPIAGCVVENGAIYVLRKGSRVLVHDACDEAERRARRARLERLVNRVHEVDSGVKLTDDALARRSDVTWDVGETTTLAENAVHAIIREIEAAGAYWSLSSVHLHATFDVDDKASGAVRFCARELGVGAGSALARFAFIGDSYNDASCFAAFRTTFGVANVRSSAMRMSVPPRYVATLPMGEGFAEVAREILAHRSSRGAPGVC
jgi:hydroxymethylpyrimidine pyrophosphatase-like HAD family hydrolase